MTFIGHQIGGQVMFEFGALFRCSDPAQKKVLEIFFSNVRERTISKKQKQTFIAITQFGLSNTSCNVFWINNTKE